MEGTADTRSRIQAIALDLFTEHGYDRTSLREIAERLGVTKAALYYHFRSKDEIVNSFVEDRVAALDELIDWVGGQPAGPHTRQELLRRYSDQLRQGHHHQVMRFFERNRARMKDVASAEKLRQRMFDLVDLLCPPHAAPADRLRCGLALTSIHTSRFVLPERLPAEQRWEAVMEVASDLLAQVNDRAKARPGPPV